MKSLRQPGEPAEVFLRRVAVRRWPSARHLPVEVQQDLREYFGQQDAGCWATRWLTMNDWFGVTGGEDALAARAQICGVKTVTTRSWAGSGGCG